MESHCSAEVCKLVGILILLKFAKHSNQTYDEFYRDNVLIAVKDLKVQQANRISENINQRFKNLGFKTEIATNLLEVKFLDVT